MRNYIVIIEGKPVYIRLDMVNKVIDVTVKAGSSDYTAKAKLKEVKKKEEN